MRCYRLECCVCYLFFFKQKTAYEMRISDWSSDVCSSDLSAAMSDKDIDIAGAIRNLGGDILDLPFWEACRDGRFLLHRCNVCGRHYWPASRCVVHGAQSMAWLPASGRGTLYTYTVMHHAYKIGRAHV